MMGQVFDLRGIDLQEPVNVVELYSPYEGQKLHMQFREGCTSEQFAVFPCVHGELLEAVPDGGRLHTGAGMLQTALGLAGKITLVVVRKGAVVAPEDVSASLTVPITYEDGRQGCMDIRLTASPRARCRDEWGMARAYLDGRVCGMAELERRVRDDTEGRLHSLTAGSLLDSLERQVRQEGPLRALRSLPERSSALSRALREVPTPWAPWLEMESCEVRMEAVNREELDTGCNSEYRWYEKKREMVLEAMKEHFHNPTPEITQLMITYIQSNPGADQADMLRYAEGLRKLLLRYEPRQLLALVEQRRLTGR